MSRAFPTFVRSRKHSLDWSAGAKKEGGRGRLVSSQVYKGEERDQVQIQLEEKLLGVCLAEGSRNGRRSGVSRARQVGILLLISSIGQIEVCWYRLHRS